MALLGEEEGVQAGSNGVAGTPRANPETLDALNGLNSKGATNPITVNDFKPQDDKPNATGDLGRHTYYPGMDQPTRVGNYSGNQVGSIDLFAPTGNYVPLGMMDARDMAIHKAALQKQQDDQDFYKKHQRPVTKDTQIQPELTKQYNNYIAQNVASAKKKYEKNYVAFLNQDPDFNAGLNNMQDVAKHYDAVVEHDLALDAAEKDPNFVVSPQLRQSRVNLHKSIRAVGDNPASPEARKLVDDFLNSKATYDLDAVSNDFLKTIKPDVNETDINEALKAGKKVGTEQILDQVKKTSYSPERMEPGMQNMYQQRYSGDPMAPSYEDFRKSVLSKVNEHVEHQFKNFDTYHAPPANHDEDYSQAVPQSNATINQTIPNTTAKAGIVGSGTRKVYMENVYNTSVKDQTKELTFALNPNITSLDGEPLNEKSGYIKGQVQQIASMPYYKDQKRFLTPEEAEGLKKVGGAYHNSGIEWKPAAIVNITPTTDDKGDVQESRSAIVPLGDIKGKFGTSFDKHAIEKVESDAENKNVSKEKPHGGITYKGVYHSPEAISRAAKESGMTPEQYKIELSKQQ